MTEKAKSRDALLEGQAEPGGQVEQLEAADAERARGEERPRESEERNRVLAESADDYIFRIGRDLRVEYVNEAGARALGKGAEEILGHAVGEVFPSETAEHQRAALLRVLETGQVLSTEAKHRFLADDLWLSTKLSPLRNEAGDVVGILGVSRDITDRKRAEEALKESEGQLRSLLEHAPDTVLTVDREGIITYINRPAPGMTLKDFIGKDSVGALPPEYRDRYRQAMRRVFDTGETDELGHGFHGETWWTARLVPLEQDDEVVSVMIISTDITDRKRAEEEIKNLARFPSENPSPVLRISAEGTILYANPASRALLDQWGVGEGRPVPEDIGWHVADARRSGTSRVEDVAAGKRVYSFVIAPVPGADYVNMYGRDISEHRCLEEQLRQIQKMEAIGVLAGGVAHDFNNLLTPILGYANMLKIRSQPEDDAFRFADTIEQAATRAGELTRQLLGFARQGKLQAVTVDMHRMVGEVVPILSRAMDRRIVMVQRLGAEPSCVTGDPGQLQQVIMNLVINARDAMPNGGDLTFETSVVELDEEYCRTHTEVAPGQHLLLSVTDTGTGIPEDVRDRVFEPFFTTKEVGRGTGMGLATAYGIVKNHAGSIQFHSEVGEGTTFKVYLPLCRESVADDVKPPAGAPTAGKGRILVVDDEETVCAIAKEMLASLGYEVDVVRDGQQAVDHYREHGSRTDLVLLDITMPVMDGRECFRRLKENDPEVKALLSTGHALDDAAQELLDEGMVGFVQKPYIVAGLSEAVAKALGR